MNNRRYKKGPQSQKEVSGRRLEIRETYIIAYQELCSFKERTVYPALHSTSQQNEKSSDDHQSCPVCALMVFL